MVDARFMTEGLIPLPFLDSPTRFGSISIFLHWLTALAIPTLFALGWWMTGLDYYHPWYLRAPEWHVGSGLLLFGLLILRVLWRAAQIAPQPLPTKHTWEARAAIWNHYLMLTLSLLASFSGYLIVTATGQAASIFDAFTVPALPAFMDRQEDLAGSLHWYSAVLLMALVALHAAAALKHHFLDRDATLTRMLGIHQESKP